MQVKSREYLAVVDFSGRNESKSCIEAVGATFPRRIAGEQLGRSLCADQSYYFLHDRLAIAAALMPVIDEQLPQEPRSDELWRLRLHVPAQHDEPDRPLVNNHGTEPRIRLWAFGRLRQRLGY